MHMYVATYSDVKVVQTLIKIHNSEAKMKQEYMMTDSLFTCSTNQKFVEKLA